MGVLLDNHLINSVFRQRDEEDVVSKIKLTYLGWFIHLPYTLWGGCCCKLLCIKRFYSRYEHRVVTKEVGARRIERELDIVNFLRKQLVLNAIIKATTTRTQRGLARKNYRLIVGQHSEKDTTDSSDYDPSVTHPMVV